jgi:2-polyprenyl-3-methyl-5-hydroxy-6-metoxy-1,4-benzoquinol methylase
LKPKFTDEPLCPVCGTQDSRKEFTVTDFFVSGEIFPVIRCMNCGFRHTGKAPGPGEIARYYQSEAYISHSNTRQGLVNRLYHTVRRFMLKKKAGIVKKTTGLENGNLLDIGAGTGYFLHFMQTCGWTVSGTEKDGKARNFSSEHWGIGLLPDEGLFSLPDQSYDAITMWHVLEHLSVPSDYLEKAASLLKPAGCLIIALPNPGSYDARHYRQYWAAWDVPRHLWHFLPENVEKLASKAGFILRRTYRMPFDAFYVSILSEKYRGSKAALLKGVFFGKISWILSLFSPEKCSSLIYEFRLQNTL